MHKKFFGVVAIFLLAGQHTEAQSFNKTQLTISPMPGVYSDLEWIDMDGDQDLDIVELYANPYDAQQSFVKIYRNDNQSFTQMQNAFGGTLLDPKSYDFHDFDSDGDIDLMFIDSEAVKIAVNNGSFSFTIQNTGIDNPGSFAPEVHWRDLDGDLDADIVFDTFIYLNASGTYSAALFKMPAYTRNRSWADVNNDGLMDMVATKGQTSGVNPLFLFVNQGSGLFKEVSMLSAGYWDTGRTQWLDADADDDLDLLITESDDKCTLFENTFSQSGLPSFERAWSFRALPNPQVDAGDVNLDGRPDIILSGQGSVSFQTFLYLNTTTGGDLAFAESELEVKPYFISNFDLLDVDGDLDLDLFVLGWQDEWYLIREQNAYIINPQSSRPNPNVPTDLASSVESNVTLTWNHNDNQGAAYFAVAIKRNGVSFSPGFTLAAGKFLMPGLLTHSTAKQLTLRDLPSGNYEWQVEAYDHAFRVSGFSTTNTFSILDAPTGVTLDVLAYNKVRLNWQFAGTATHFAVFRRSSNGALTEIGTVPSGIANLTDDHVPPNENVEYVVKAIFNGAYSAPSAGVAYYSSQFDEVSFSPAGPNIITASGVSADFDNDQDYDLGFAGRIDLSDGNSTLLANNGSAQFTEAAFLPDIVDTPVPIIARDMDNDGDIDVCAVVGSASTGHVVTVYENSGATFTKSFETASYPRVSQMSLEDLNNDGLPDLMIKRSIGNSSSSPPTYSLLFQTQAGDFEDSKIEFLEKNVGSDGLGDFHLADLNNDGFTDVVFSGAAPDVKARVFINQEGEAFSETPLSLSSLSDPVFFDINGDGHMDIIQRGFQVLYVHNGLGNLVFAAPYEISIASVAENNSVSINIADMDFNGLPDLIVNDESNVALLYNNGNGNFARAQYQFAGDWETKIFLTDMESDGDLDIVKLGNDNSHDGLNHFYRNKALSVPGDNVGPTVPASIQMTRTRNAVTLSWDASSDDTTPAALISYQVHIKDNNGKIWLHAETNAAGDFRRRLAYGNAGFRTSYTINNLPAGQYTAYVQAVDASFKLSALSSPFDFQIAAGPSNLVIERQLLDKVKLTWNDGPFVGTKTIVSRKSFTSDFEIVAELPANTTEYIDEDLSFDNLYTYQIYEIVAGAPTAGSNLITWNTALLSIEQSSIVNVTGSLDVGDYTGDGKMDLLIHGGRIYNGTTLDFTNALFEKTALGWAEQNVGSTTSNTGTSYFYDINGDFQPDLYQYGYFYLDDEYKTQVFLNNGNKTFTGTSDLFTAEYFRVDETWDYDRDNDLDYYVWKPDGGTSLLKNNAAGNFAKDEVFISCCNNALITGDFDHDGDEDIVQFNKGNNNFELLLNKDGGMHRNATLPVYNGRMQKVDYNGDGWTDLLFLSGSNSVKSKLYKNTGPNAEGIIQFKVVKDDLPHGEVTANAADYDHDGDVDIFFAASPCIMVNNEGGDVFRENIMSEFSAFNGLSRWVDFDADGDLDVFVMGYLTVDYQEGIDEPYAYVLNNQLIVGGKGTTNEPPSAPTSLTAHQDVDGLHLSWTNQADDHTSADALTNDVVLYKDGKQIVKGPLNPSTEKRFKLEDGRTAGLLLLDNLPYGDYTWKVQAVDQSYLGSPLSVGGQFTFIPQPPVMKDTVIYQCDRTIVLTAAGTSIEWYSDAALTQKVASDTYSPQSSQTVYVTQTIDGRRGVSRPVEITIHDRPEKPVPAVNPYLYCENNAGNLAYINVAGTDVQWYKDVNKTIAAGSGNHLEVSLSESTYYATQTIGGCESLPVEVVVKAEIIDSHIYFEDGKIYTSEENGTQYQWYRNNVAVPNSNSYVIDLTHPNGEYRVLIEKGMCSELSEVAAITAIEENKTDNLKVYPNPARENFTIELPQHGNATIKIYDVAGKVIYEKAFAGTTDHTLQIPSATWSSGVYFIMLTNEQDTRVRKILIR